MAISSIQHDDKALSYSNIRSRNVETRGVRSLELRQGTGEILSDRGM